MKDCVKLGLAILTLYFMTTYDCHHLRNIVKEPYFPELWHYPGLYTPELDPMVGNDTYVPHRNYTPDFRLEEPYYTVYDGHFFREYNRPYRLTPHIKQTMFFDINENAWLLGCYCCCVYKQHHILSTCSILTHRHVLTTATATDVVLRNYAGMKIAENVLGIWYDHNEENFNTTTYHPGVARIHYHPLYRRDYEGNVSHPIPCLYDLAVWTSYWVLGNKRWPQIVLCQRGGSTIYVSSHTINTPDDRVFMVGFLFMKAYARRPMPWFKFGVRTNTFVLPCPKTDWHWFHCVQGDWARYGMDSGGALHLMDLERTGRLDGLTGVCTFSLHLRSKGLVHYYTVVDTHPVLDFIYDAYMGNIKPVFLDYRFADSKNGAPTLLFQHHISVYYTTCFQPITYRPPNYRR